MPREDPPLRPPEPARSSAAWWLLALAVVAAAGWWWWTSRPMPPGAPAAAPPVAGAPAAPPAAAGPRHPLEPSDAGPLAVADTPAALATLLGQEAVARFLVSDDFARRLVATIDNLGREQAPASHWPVQPTPGRFTVAEAGGTATLAAANAARYAPFVDWIAGVDAGGAADLYRRLYPQLQQAWVDLGMGGRHLNDRVIEVIDLLLATPEPAAPPAVKLTEVRGPVPSTRPWVRYEFVDAQLQGLSAGQKILVRVGQPHGRQLKAKLRELRAQLVRGTS